MKKGLTDNEMAAFGRDMAMMLSAGLTPANSMDVLAESLPDQSLNPAWQKLKQKLADGQPLAATLSDSGLFSPYFCQMTELGTKAGRQENTMYKLADYYQRQAEIKQKLHDTMIQPLILFAVLGLIMIALIVAVLPVFAGVYQRLGGDKSGFVTAAYILAGIGLAGIVVMVIIMLTVTIKAKKGESLDKTRQLLIHSSLTGPALKRLSQAEIMAVLDITINSGMNPDEALALTERIGNHQAVETELKTAISQTASGKNIGLALDSSQLLDPLSAHLIYAGSRNGQIEQAVSTVSQQVFQDAFNMIDAVIGRIEPLITGIFTAIIGLTMLAVMLPLIAVITAIG